MSPDNELTPKSVAQVRVASKRNCCHSSWSARGILPWFCRPALQLSPWRRYPGNEAHYIYASYWPGNTAHQFRLRDAPGDEPESLFWASLKWKTSADSHDMLCSRQSVQLYLLVLTHSLFQYVQASHIGFNAGGVPLWSPDVQDVSGNVHETGAWHIKDECKYLSIFLILYLHLLNSPILNWVSLLPCN